ncbi:hypothetical protein E2C01_001400 [Portunus trituberculatus]|uniref:Uncharacterized protein n=1 Tax=Portunus trituberculatus TaxID=210409 RepID=A0A5B7CH36_PORTR|nr:hypothetical protein [Portunus trituberculatus]
MNGSDAASVTVSCWNFLLLVKTSARLHSLGLLTLYRRGWGDEGMGGMGGWMGGDAGRGEEKEERD